MKLEEALKNKKNPDLELESFEGVLNIIFFTFDGIGLSVAKKLIDEGNNVVVAEIRSKKELGEDDDEEAESKKRRLSQYDGIVEKHDAMLVMKSMEGIKDKDKWIIFFDFNNLSLLSEKVLSMGFEKGMFPLIADTELEKDRDKAKDIVKEFYKDLSVAEVHDYKKVEDAMSMLEESEKMWVLKGNSDAAKTVVPYNDDPELAKQIIIDCLEAHKADYESEGFILEEKIIGGYELTPQIVFLDGKFVFTDIDIENKNIGSGNISVQTGSMQTLVIKTQGKDEINKLAFPKWIYDKAKQHKGLFVADAGLICKDDKYYFTEFCFQRFGFDSLFAELTMSGSATDFFKKVFIEGKNPLIDEFGVAIRALNMHKDDKERRVLSGISMLTDDTERTWMFEAKMEEDKIVSTGTSWDLVVFSGSGDTIDSACDVAYETSEMFAFEDLYLRPKFDFMSCDYQSSIPNRFTELNHRLFEADDMDTSDEYRLAKLERAYNKKVGDLSKEIREALKEDE